MNTKPRYTASIDKIVLHDPEGANTARELYNYLQNISAGYHAMVDDQELIVAATDDKIVEGAGGMNTHGLHICFVPGRAAWSRDEWMTHELALRRGAGWIAAKAILYDIPLVHLTPYQVATTGVKGICTHGDVTAAGFTASEGHTDPGPNFPIDQLLSWARGEPTPTEEYEDMIIDAPRRQQKNAVRPACARLDLAGKKIVLMNGARLQQANLTVPASGDLRGWYETYTLTGRKRGFKVVGAKDSTGNPAFEYTWA